MKPKYFSHCDSYNIYLCLIWYYDKIIKNNIAVNTSKERGHEAAILTVVAQPLVIILLYLLAFAVCKYSSECIISYYLYTYTRRILLYFLLQHNCTHTCDIICSTGHCSEYKQVQPPPRWLLTIVFLFYTHKHT